MMTHPDVVFLLYFLYDVQVPGKRFHNCCRSMSGTGHHFSIAIAKIGLGVGRGGGGVTISAEVYSEFLGRSNFRIPYTGSLWLVLPFNSMEKPTINFP